ncbi:MAG: hypothetical protein II747_02860, partial [Clostridia bacterium]|nr:hypothetical protein [Clostridia bacterium]
YSIPFVMTSGDHDEGEGDGTNGWGKGDDNIKPIPFEDWITAKPKEMDGIDGIDENDYYEWWLSKGFSKDEWLAVNGGSRSWPGDNN